MLLSGVSLRAGNAVLPIHRHSKLSRYRIFDRRSIQSLISSYTLISFWFRYSMPEPAAQPGRAVNVYAASTRKKKKIRTIVSRASGTFKCMYSYARCIALTRGVVKIIQTDPDSFFLLFFSRPPLYILSILSDGSPVARFSVCLSGLRWDTF